MGNWNNSRDFLFLKNKCCFNSRTSSSKIAWLITRFQLSIYSHFEGNKYAVAQQMSKVF